MIVHHGEDVQNNIYTVTYTAYLNENILSVVIKSTLKEGNNAQRVTIQSYVYNISTNKELTLQEMLKIKELDSDYVQEQINETIQASINYSENLISLGYETFKRNINDEMYKIENSNNYFLGPNRSIYIIYAYGNENPTTESDIVYIK